ETWSANQVLGYYRNAPAGANGNTQPLPISSDWYMSDNGPGRFYNPSMFPVVQSLFDGTIQLQPGSYNIGDVAAQSGSSVSAKLDQYFTATGSSDYEMRALIFGETSAKIFGTVNVDQNGTITLQDVTIAPYNDQFNFLVNKDWLSAGGFAANVYNWWEGSTWG